MLDAADAHFPDRFQSRFKLVKFRFELVEPLFNTR